MKLNLLILMAAAIIFGGCNNSSSNSNSYSTTSKDSTTVTTTAGTASSSDEQAGKDSSFLASAYATGLFEIKIGELANQKSSNANVKSLAAMMIKDHSGLNEKVEALAKAKSIALSTQLPDDVQKKYDELSALSGKDFDKEYANINVEGHEDAIKDFEKAASGNSAADVKDLASSALPNLKMHKEHSEEVKKGLGNAM